MPENADTSVAGDTAAEEVIQAVKDNATVSDGVVQLDKEAMDAVVDATEANFFAARRRLNREMKILFDDNGIEIPFNQIVMHQAEN